MRYLMFFASLAYLISSCQWSPERDNPFDPNAIGFSDPHFNSPPRIDEFYATTHFFTSYLNPIYEYELVCVVSDTDNNFPPTPQAPVFVSKYPVEDDSIFIGYLGSTGGRQEFFLRGLRDSLPIVSEEYQFTVIFEDDSGASATAVTRIENWRSFAISLVNPDPDVYPNIIRDVVPSIIWRRVTGSQYSHFRITLSLNGQVKPWIWDNISISDTVATLPQGILVDDQINPGALYTVYLTLFDTQGNSGTGRPASFFYRPSVSLSDESYRREDNDD